MLSFRLFLVHVKRNFCDAQITGCPVDYCQPAEYLCLLSQDPYMSKMTTLAHTSILTKMYILYKKELIYNFPKLGLLPIFLQNT